jgi:hypothetical protein
MDCPRIHKFYAAIKEVTAPIGGFGLVLDGVG